MNGSNPDALDLEDEDDHDIDEDEGTKASAIPVVAAVAATVATSPAVAAASAPESVPVGDAGATQLMPAIDVATLATAVIPKTASDIASKPAPESAPAQESLDLPIAETEQDPVAPKSDNAPAARAARDIPRAVYADIPQARPMAAAIAYALHAPAMMAIDAEDAPAASSDTTEASAEGVSPTGTSIATPATSNPESSEPQTPAAP